MFWRQLFGVRFAAVAHPFPLELVIQNLRTTTSRQTGFGQRQLAHLHIVFPGDEQDRRLVSLHFHLTNDPAAVEVRIPPETIVIVVYYTLFTPETGLSTKSRRAETVELFTENFIRFLKN